MHKLGNTLRPLLAGLTAGLVWMVVGMALAQIALGASIWSPPRTMASIVLGDPAVTGMADFDASIVGAGILVYLVLAVAYAYLAALLILRAPPGFCVLTGAALGLAAYGLNFYGLAVFWEQASEARNGAALASHVVFGIVLGWILMPISARHGLPGRQHT